MSLFHDLSVKQITKSPINTQESQTPSVHKPKQPESAVQNGHKHNDKSDEKMYDEKHSTHIQSHYNQNINVNGYSHDQQQSSQLQLIDPTQLSFNLDTIDEKYLKKTQQIYYTQCASLKVNDAQQKVLFQLLSIQRKNNNYPLMSYLIDCYSRDKLHYFLNFYTQKHQKSITIEEWSKHKTYKTVLKLTYKQPKCTQIRRMIVSAMETYFKRYCHPIMLPTPYKIHDSIQRFTECIHEVGGLISAIRKNQMQILPFQIDLVIIPQDVIDINDDDDDTYDAASASDNSDFDKHESSEDEDEDDSSSDEDDEAPKPNINKWCAAIGDIETRLKNQNIRYTHQEKPRTTMEREFRFLYTQFTQMIDTSKKIKNITNRFPHRKRFCIVVDRRLASKEEKENENDNKDDLMKEEKNEIYLFEPPAPYNKMPDNHVKEWYIESSYQCIIPGSIRNNDIKSKSSLDGWINIFSFHVEQTDEIRCYFYRNGQILRFLPSDIVNLFPHLFEKREDNDMFIQYESESKKNINKMNKTWKDIHFDHFRKQLS